MTILRVDIVATKVAWDSSVKLKAFASSKLLFVLAFISFLTSDIITTSHRCSVLSAK